MTLETLQLLALVAATVTTGLVGGLFYGFSISVMRALRGTDDRTFIEVMQRINTAILNGWFVLGYIGALLFTGAAVALLGPDRHDALYPAAGALFCYAASMLITGRFNIPLNKALDAAGPPARIPDPARVRAAFEPAWVRWNTVRTLLCVGAVLLLCWALVVHGG
ncbi:MULTISPECIES: anthrone oxygenase family protein [Streptomyces]|uniref:anthrone oxygenase family protein n=1 Tax=Streptomyces TaxID=1883 RepID=UPI001E57F1F9|nr:MULTISPECIES: anthrone oxygenase family protein [Streptomyces]